MSLHSGLRYKDAIACRVWDLCRTTKANCLNLFSALSTAHKVIFGMWAATVWHHVLLDFELTGRSNVGQPGCVRVVVCLCTCMLREGEFKAGHCVCGLCLSPDLRVTAWESGPSMGCLLLTEPVPSAVLGISTSKITGIHVAASVRVI